MTLFSYLCGNYRCDMYLKRLLIKDFKNIAEADLNFSPGLNCICGDNGEGKTNLLDAVWYLSMTRSFLLPNDRFACRRGAERAVLNGTYPENDGEEHSIALSVGEKGEKILRRDGKNCPRLSDHIGAFPVAVVSPSDSALINDAGEERRRFLNMMLSQTDRQYLKALQNYNRCLQQRNKVLHQMAENAGGGASNAGLDLLLETLSSQMESPASYIYGARKNACERLSALVSEFYGTLSDGREAVALAYRSDLSKGSFSDLLKDNFSRDRALQYTSVGIQRDDLQMTMDSFPMRQCASQGQQKSFLVSLKLAQYHLMREVYGVPPILLLDDIFDKLDFSRVANLLRMVSSPEFGQIFITDTDGGRLASIAEGASFFKVKGGVFS